MTEQAPASAAGLGQAGHGARRCMALHRPPQRVIEGVRAGLTAIMKPENAPTYQGAQDLCIGLRLSLLQATRQAGDTAAAPGALRAEARVAIRPLLERIGLGARLEYLGGSAAEQAAGLVPVMEAVLLGWLDGLTRPVEGGGVKLACNLWVLHRRFNAYHLAG